MHTRPAMIWALALASAVLAAEAAPSAPASPQGGSWDSIKQLPDWSGVWALSDQSWAEVMGDFSGHDGGRVPLTPKYRALRAANLAGGAGPVSNELRCMPMGMPGITAVPIGAEYLFTPGRVTVVYENDEVRRIDTSGHPHPAESDLYYSFAGDSIGHWEDKTLVVDTIGILPQSELFLGLRVAKNTHIHERLQRVDADTLRIDTVVDNPEMFTKPFAYTRTYKRSSDPPYEYNACNANNRESGSKAQNVDLTPPPAVEHR